MKAVQNQNDVYCQLQCNNVEINKNTFNFLPLSSPSLISNYHQSVNVIRERKRVAKSATCVSQSNTFCGGETNIIKKVHSHKKLKKDKKYPLTCKYKVDGPDVVFCRNKELTGRLSCRVLKDQCGYYVELVVHEVFQDIPKGILLGVIKKAPYQVKSLPLNITPITYTISNIKQQSKSELDFKDLLKAFADVEFICNHTRLTLKGHDHPINISVTKTNEVYGLEIDPDTIKLFNLRMHAVKLKKKDGKECVVLQLSGPDGTIIPKGTSLARVCYEPFEISEVSISESKTLEGHGPIQWSGTSNIKVPRNKTKRVIVRSPTKRKVGKVNIIHYQSDENMPLITKSYTLDCSLQGIKYTALLDTGSCTTCISKKAFSKLSMWAQAKLRPTKTSFAAAQGTPLEAIGEMDLYMEAGTWNGWVKFIVMNNLSEDVILGQNYLQTFTDSISITNHQLIMRNRGTIQLKTEGSPIHIQRADAKLSHSYVIPAGHVRLVKVISPLKLQAGDPVYVEPHTWNLGTQGLMVAHLTSMVSKDNHIQIAVVNPQDTDIKIDAGMIVGQVHPLIKKHDDVYETTSSHHISLVKEPETETLNHKSDVESLLEQQHLSVDQRQAILKLLDKYPGLRGEQGLGKTSVTTHKIDTGNAQPMKAPSWRRPEVEHLEIEKEVKTMQDLGVIEKSSSPWNAPVLLVKKPDGSWRFCVDYRKLNALTKKDCYPIPRIDETIDKLGKAKVFTTLDLKSGYWQVGMADVDKDKTAFTTRSGHWHFTVMPFGLCNAPATFQRLMDLVLDEHKYDFTLVYLDDIIVYSDTFENHLKHLDCVFNKIHKAGLTLKINKCTFAANELKFLGHKITKDGVAVLPEKVDAVRNCRQPKNTTDVKSFLGLANYYRRFVPSFSTVAAPLNALTSDREWQWTDACQLSFNTLKDLLTSAPILRRPDYNKPFVVYTDASNVGIGGLLTQEIDGVEYVIAYASRTLSSAERNYGVTERECLAVVYSLKEFRPYVYGTRFKVVTDHMSLTWLAKLHETNPRLTRWILAISEYDFTIAYRPGKSHSNADALSRLPPPNAQGEIKEEYVPMSYKDVLSINVVTTRSKKSTQNNEISTNSTLDGGEPVLGLGNEPMGRPRRVRRAPELYGERIVTDYYHSYLKSIDHDQKQNKLKPPLLLYPDQHEGTSDTSIQNKSITEEHSKEDKKSLPAGVELAKKADNQQSLPSNHLMSFRNSKTKRKKDELVPTMESSNSMSKKKRKTKDTKLNQPTVSLSEDTSSSPLGDTSAVPVETTIVDVPQHSETQTENTTGHNNNTIVDDGNDEPLSAVEVDVSQTLSLDDVRKEQDLDPYWKGVKRYLLLGTLPEDVSLKIMILTTAPDYELIDDVLYYWPKKYKKDGTFIDKRLVIPKRFRQELIHLHHSSLFAGHLGAEKTYLRLYKKYFWVNMYKDTYEYCRSCDLCQRAKLTKRQLPIIKHKTYCGTPFTDCYTDYIGPLPISSGMSYIIVFICPFTKWVEAKAVCDADAETAALAFVELVVARHGVPQRVISDQGTHFTANLFQQMMKVLSTRNVFTTPYHAQSNGQCERMNGTLVQLLRIYCQNNKEKWAEYLPYALFAYRSSIHESTGYTPFEMLYGRNPSLPGEEKLNASDNQSIDDFAKNLKVAMQQIHEIARSKLKKLQDAHYAKEQPAHIKRFKVGDKVLVKDNDSKKHKFEYVYQGPFTILEEIHGGVAYKIDQPKPTLGKSSCTVSVSHLKKYKEPK